MPFIPPHSCRGDTPFSKLPIRHGDFQSVFGKMTFKHLPTKEVPGGPHLPSPDFKRDCFCLELLEERKKPSPGIANRAQDVLICESW